MTHKVLSIICWICFIVMGLVYGVCFVYTAALPAVREGVAGITQAIDGSVAAATSAMETTWDFNGILPEATPSADTAGQTAESQQQTSYVPPSGEQGDAYSTWRAAIGDPLGSIFSGTGVTETLIEGVAGGSISATDALQSLDEAALQGVSVNAANYASTIAALSVPSTLPDGARASMWEAQSAAQSFAASVQSVVSAVRSVKGGNVLAIATELVPAANEAFTHLQELDSALTSAESQLG